MTDRFPKGALLAAVTAVLFVLLYLAYSRPGYFTSQTYLAEALFLEVLLAAVWMYRQMFFPVVVVVFLFAGMGLPLGSGWNVARWVSLATGALVGLLIVLKNREHHFGLFHIVALFAVLAGFVSVAVSRYTTLSLLKVLSLLLLFAYAGTGARLAVFGRENRFFDGLLTSCEVFVGLVGAAYVSWFDVMGNPNSLGAVMGIVAAPILLWGTLASDQPSLRRRRALSFVVCAGLIFASNSRAAMIAGFLVCALLCVALRKYRVLMQGIVILTILASASAILRPESYSNTVSSLTREVLFKGKDPSLGVLSSRKSPWQDAVESIQTHWWFGTGFGTSDNGTDPTEHLGNFSTSSDTSKEHGSSYLAITAWVGLLGAVPFYMLLLMLFTKVVQTVAWMIRTGNATHPAIPLAMVMLAGLIHAGFEDWLFAPGYYITVFYWCMAFVLVDYVPRLRDRTGRGQVGR